MTTYAQEYPAAVKAAKAIFDAIKDLPNRSQLHRTEELRDRTLTEKAILLGLREVSCHALACASCAGPFITARPDWKNRASHWRAVVEAIDEYMVGDVENLVNLAYRQVVSREQRRKRIG